MNYPLFLSYDGAIFGKGFVAEINAVGRLLATVEAEGVWLYGVNPGAISVDGRSLDEAHLTMREALRQVFLDFAREADSFDAFKLRVERFFDETDDASIAEWDAAVQAVRASAVPTINLPQTSAETKHKVSVTLKQMKDITPDFNVPAMNVPHIGTANLQLAKAA